MNAGQRLASHCIRYKCCRLPSEIRPGYPWPLFHTSDYTCLCMQIYIIKIYIKKPTCIVYAVPVLGTRWFHAVQSQLQCFCHHFSSINHQVDTFKELFRQAHFNIQLCSIDVTLVTLSARRVAGSTAAFV